MKTMNINNTEIETATLGSKGTMIEAVKPPLQGSIIVDENYKYVPNANPSGSNLTTDIEPADKKTLSRIDRMLNAPQLTPMSQISD